MLFVDDIFARGKGIDIHTMGGLVPECYCWLFLISGFSLATTVETEMNLVKIFNDASA